MRWLRPTAIAVVMLLIGACGPTPQGRRLVERQTTPRSGVTGGGPPAPVPLTEKLLETGLNVPWEVVFAPGGRGFEPGRGGFSPEGNVFLSERGGRVLLLPAVPIDLMVIHEFDLGGSGEAGLLGLAASPNFAVDRKLYAYYAAADDNRVVRFKVPGPADTLVEEEPIVTGIPRAAADNGGRIAFGPDGMLYVATGDASNPQRAQDLRSLAGKILRVTPDGGIPAGNPFPGSPVWSYGHRNVEGLAWDAAGRMFASEMGEDDDDEINLIRPGGNYGWPAVTGTGGSPAYVDPIFVRQPSEASWSGLLILKGSAIPQWEGDLLVAALRGQRLWRIRLRPDGTVSESESLYTGRFGRLRAVVQAPDGAIWITTSNRDGRGAPRPGDDRVVRIGPRT